MHHLSSSPFRRLLSAGLLGLFLSSATLRADEEAGKAATPALAPLTIQDGHFVDPAGKPVRFWGVNLVSLFPTREQADAIAETLANRQINLARPHHLLRPSGDWNPKMVSGAIVTYKDTSREFDPEALERFDYLNAALRKKGIYLAMSAHFSRDFLPGDVDILETTPEDRAAWQEGVKELNGWNWKKAIDPKKSLPVIDERAALIVEEFTRKLLEHKNPHTGIVYAQDPQILTMEVINESSLEYAVICGNRFPAHFQQKLEARWQAFCQDKGVEAGDLYKPANPKMKDLRAEFLRSLDAAYFERIKTFLASLGCKAPVTFSNLWRGDSVADMHYQQADWVENHAYISPRVVDKNDDGIYSANRNALEGKPFFIGELNQSEGGENIAREKPFRPMVEVATVAYGALQDWDGLIWFAWNHGDRNIAPDGASREAGRDAKLGEMMSDHMMQDHLRSLGYVFRNGLIRPSTQPVTLWTDKPYYAGNYHGLMRGKTNYKPGWQSVHRIRRAYGPVPEGQSTAPWMTESPKNPVVSDTGEIIKDMERKQLTIAAPQVEIFSGELDDSAPKGPAHLSLKETEGFATVVLVALDHKPLKESRHLLVSRTLVDKDLKETSGPAAVLKDLRSFQAGTAQFTATRTMAGPAPSPQAIILETSPSGLALPAGDWTEAELRIP